uniref:uncharacterized protein LOC120890624 n=1 Tax=Ictidomys tridecemlineatus TaxID=43179 RepID=UPI001A9E5699|nr:uncharacterized protein LOC120890624 [Ictidomys tridecemlineatus]
MELIFSSVHPDWTGKEATDQYCQAPLGEIKAAAGKPTDLAKVMSSWHPDSLPISLEHTIAACPETWDKRLLTGTGPKRSQQKRNHSSHGTKSLHTSQFIVFVLPSAHCPEPYQVHTVLNVKDAFFSLPLAKVSQPIFISIWSDPEGRFSGQLTWTQLSQGFKSSPTLFDGCNCCHQCRVSCLILARVCPSHQASWLTGCNTPRLHFYNM